MTRHGGSWPFRPARAISALRAAPRISRRYSPSATGADQASEASASGACHVYVTPPAVLPVVDRRAMEVALYGRRWVACRLAHDRAARSTDISHDYRMRMLLKRRPQSHAADPAAMLIGLLAVVAISLLEAGKWERMDTAVTGSALVAVTCFWIWSTRWDVTAGVQKVAVAVVFLVGSMVASAYYVQGWHGGQCDEEARATPGVEQLREVEVQAIEDDCVGDAATSAAFVPGLILTALVVGVGEAWQRLGKEKPCRTSRR